MVHKQVKSTSDWLASFADIDVSRSFIDIRDIICECLTLYENFMSWGGSLFRISISKRRLFSTMKAKTRLAILECDTPLPNTREKYGGYGGVFKSLLNNGAKAEGFASVEDVLDISMHQIESDPDCYPNINNVDALLMTGSSELTLDLLAFSTVDTFVRTRRPLRYTMDQQAC